MFSLPISLPDGYSLKTSKDAVVKIGDILAEKIVVKNVIVPLAEKFDIDPKNVISILKKGPGDKIEKGDILAEKKGIIKVKRAISQFEGTVLKLEEDTGNLLIKSQLKDEVVQLKSPVDGRINFCDNGKVVIETEKKTFSTVKSFGKDTKGELVFLGKEKIELEDIDKKIAKKVILAKSFDRSALSKAFGLGSLAAIGNTILDEDIEHFKNREIEALMVEVDDKSFEELTKANGKEVYLDAVNKIIVIL
ncbi:MAG TPA: hypothetical protein VFD45_00265 [Patescibacteria group bacterium]|nr:hypothetical protein [Patescibacteria group bacterium]